MLRGVVVWLEVGGGHVSALLVAVLHIPPLPAPRDGDHAHHLAARHAHHAALLILRAELVLREVELAPAREYLIVQLPAPR